MGRGSLYAFAVADVALAAAEVCNAVEGSQHGVDTPAAACHEIGWVANCLGVHLVQHAEALTDCIAAAAAAAAAV